MSNNPILGNLFHSLDGKTVFIDPKTKIAYIYDKTHSVNKVFEPGVDDSEKFDLILFLLSQPEPGKTTQLSLGTGLPDPSKTGGEPLEPSDITGDPKYFVYTVEHGFPNPITCVGFNLWQAEYGNMTSHEYLGYKKHQILSNQYDWLVGHSTCSLYAWYSAELPLFPVLGCKTHQLMISPIPEHVYKLNGQASINTLAEGVFTEEREI